MTRLPLKRSPWLVPIFWLFGATAARSYIEVTPDTLFVRFGFYRITIPRDQIESVSGERWPWYGGLGWRTDFRRRLALVGALHPIVRIHLVEPRRARLMGLPIRFQDLYVSVDSPDVLQAALVG